ncbi:hypothetical protein L0Y41_01975 [bacterium]|nr:hypothetical protein [bacterium]
MVELSVLKVLLPALTAFFIGIAITPAVSHYLYKYKLWRKRAGKSVSFTGEKKLIYNELESRAREVGTPRMGGIIVWGAASLTILLFYLISEMFLGDVAEKMNFLSRNQTWLALFTLLLGAGVGLVDDYFDVSEKKGYLPGGLSLGKRLIVVFFAGAVGAWWFYEKLGVEGIHVPFVGEWVMGFFFIPFFIAVMLALYAGGIIDGIDGLSGGVFAAIFAAYAGVAFFQNQIDLAAFCSVITGGLLAFLWFNIPPARFYLSETGTMSLTLTLAIVAFLTNSVLLLPIIAFPLFATVLSTIIQVGSKKIFGKKVFIVAPIHHHFEAKGWPAYKVTMRYWVIAAVMAALGMIIALIS